MVDNLRDLPILHTLRKITSSLPCKISSKYLPGLMFGSCRIAHFTVTGENEGGADLVLIQPFQPALLCE